MRRLAWFAGAFSLGIFLAQYLLADAWLLPGAWAFLALAVVLRLTVAGNGGRRLLLGGVGIALALGWNWLWLRQVQAPMALLADREAQLTMTLQDYAVPTAYGAKVTVRAEGLPGKLVYYGGEDLLEHGPGETVTDIVALRSARRIRDDDVTVFTSKGVFLLAYQRGAPSYGPGSSDSPRWWPARMGRAMGERIGQLAPGDQGAFLTAILTGDKTGLSRQGASDLSEAGLYHILAVSGMHCGFLLALVTLLTGRHRRRLTALCAIPLLLFYALLTGASPSVLRACVMLSLLAAAPLFRRESDGPTSLAAALFLILLTNPFAAASISLQLSFGAVAGLLWLTPRLYRLLLGGKQHGRGYRFTAASFSATMGALVFTTPLTALYFGTLVLISPLSNLCCLWAASGAFLLGLPAVLGSMVLPPLGAVLAVIPRVLSAYILAAAHLLAKLPYHALYFVNPYLKYWLLFAYGLFFTAWAGKGGRRKYALAAGLTAVSLAVTVRLGADRFSGELEVLTLDVGQGQSILLSGGEGAALVDCGSANSWYDPGAIAADYLLTMGHRRLDYLILTHFDADHINGVETLLSRVEVETLLVPAEAEDQMARRQILDLAAARGVRVRTPETGPERFSLGGAAVSVFPPVGEGADNERGLSVLAEAGEALLITGDMSAATEEALLAAWDLPDLTYLAAGHHGSKYSTGEALLQALTPETVFISAGGSSYGHPAEETLRRLAEHSCTVYRTDLHGTVRLSIQQGENHEKTGE
nr:DNA internalization-related competence protein ComEC/Rec2 [uncultured Dysosmobacter sp.]